MSFTLLRLFVFLSFTNSFFERSCPYRVAFLSVYKHDVVILNRIDPFQARTSNYNSNYVRGNDNHLSEVIPTGVLPENNDTVVSVPSFCVDYTSYLKNVTSDVRKPFILDISVYYLKNDLVMYITINTMHMGDYMSQKSTNYTVVFEGNHYPNLYTMEDKNVGYNQLKFIMRTRKVYNSYDIITFSLIDGKRRNTYSNLEACVRIPPETKLDLITCSYISSYNSIAELRAFAAFHRIQNVSMIVFYQATPIPGFDDAFHELIESGFIKVVDFTWPRPLQYKYIQMNNQQGEMNSCMNHFRFDAEAIIFCDVDEYIYSMKYPYHLPDAISFLVARYPEINVFTMDSYRITNKHNNLTYRENYLNEGTMFDELQYYVNAYVSGAKKMIVLTSMEGYLGIHICYSCSNWLISSDVARIGHFKSTVYKADYSFSDYLSMYTNDFKREISAMNQTTGSYN